MSEYCFHEDCSVRIDKFGKKKLSIHGFFGPPVLGKPKDSSLTISFSTLCGVPLLKVSQKYDFYVDKFSSQKFKAFVKDNDQVVLFLPEFEKIINFKGSPGLCQYILGRNYAGTQQTASDIVKKSKLRSPMKTMLTPQKKKSSVAEEGKENCEPNVFRAPRATEVLSRSPDEANKRKSSANILHGHRTIPKPAQSTRPTSASAPSPPKTSLSPEQQSIVDRFCARTAVPTATSADSSENLNLFITGGAGTGKSFLIANLVGHLRTKYGSDAVHLTATTGIAAANTGGITINQFSGINPQYVSGTTLDEKALLQSVCGSTTVVRRWREAKALIIDEISMMSPVMLQALNIVGQRARGNSRPMGGLLLIVCGDFFQLPPVQVQSSIKTHIGPAAGTGTGTGTEALQYCFQHRVWKQLFPSNTQNSVVLQTVFRQRDRGFIEMLERIRRGDKHDLAALNQRCSGAALKSSADRTPDVVLPTKIFTHKREVDSVNRNELQKCSSGAGGAPMEERVYKASDSGDARYHQPHQSHFPVKPTITLCIGAQVMLMKNIDVPGGLVNGARGVVVRFIKETNSPVVKFATGETRTINREHFSVQFGGRTVASRAQYPLDLCWAVSVHKAQGMTVDRVELHLRNVFEYGQAYVALSRVRTIAGLKLLAPLVADNIKAHPAVVQFYHDIEKTTNRM